MRQIIIKLLTCIIIVVYISGLSRYLVINSIHTIHHYFAHTLHHHSNHNHSHLDGHGHVHNSFVDFTLFEEKNKNQQNKNEVSLPSYKNFNFFTHILSRCDFSKMNIHLLEIMCNANLIFPQAPIIIPLHPPPRLSII